MVNLTVRDLRGRALFRWEWATSALRDDSGKVVAQRNGSDDEARRLTDTAASWMSGRQVLMDLAPADVSTPSTQADFGIPDGDFIADRVSPVRMVTRDRGVWYAESASDAIQIVDGTVGSPGNPPVLSPGFVKGSFTMTGYALAARVPRLVGSNADFDLKARTLFFLVEKLRLMRETRVAALLDASATWASGNVVTVAAGAKWNGGATANPLTDTFSALAKSFLPANTLILPENAAPFFFQNANSQAMRDYVQSGGELPDIVFARAKQMASGVPAYIWGPANPVSVPLVRVAPNPMQIGTTLTFRWLGKDGANGEERDGMLVRTFFDPQSDADHIVVAHNDAEVMVSNQVGALISGAMQ